VARGPIQSWKDFEEYKWPSAASLDTRPLEWLEKNIPDGMKCYVTVPVGYYKFLFGIESLFYLIYDEPELVSAVLTKLQNIYVEYCSIVSQFSCVGALWSSDDMGFKTQTLLPPDFIKQNILPVHRACAEIAHQNEKLFFLHSCGNLSSVMDAIIGIGIDAKHSFEDQILPVEQAKALYGDKIALLGGLDMDFLCRAEESALRARVRQLLDQCHPGGGYCLGSGNSIAKYVPVENYLIMLDEGRKYGK
jgi:uroporphyrinogen decarboxylase